MLKTISAALLAASLIAGPVLAQGYNAPTAAQPAKTDVKAGTKADVKADVKAKKIVHKVHKTKKHARHLIKHKKISQRATHVTSKAMPRVN